MALPKFFLGRVSLQQPVPAYSCLSCTTREEKKSWKKAALPGRRTARVGKKLPELEKSNKHIKQKIKRKITKTYKRKIKQQKSTHKQTAASAAPLGRRTPRVGKSEKLFEANTETNFYPYQLVNTTIFTAAVRIGVRSGRHCIFPNLSPTI